VDLTINLYDNLAINRKIFCKSGPRLSDSGVGDGIVEAVAVGALKGSRGFAISSSSSSSGGSCSGNGCRGARVVTVTNRITGARIASAAAAAAARGYRRR